MNARPGVAPQAKGYRSSTRSEIRNLLPPLKSGMKVLEVGCGEGAFCVAIPGAAETWGIEPDADSAAIARGRLSRVFVNTFDEVVTELPTAYFDLVVCNDVIEHMTDHDAFLRSVKTRMAPGAYLVGSVPNVRFHANLFNLIVARDWHYQNNGILDRTHFRFFTFRSFRRSLEDAGFEIKRLEGIARGTGFDWSLRGVVGRLFRKTLIVLSLGRAWDINYLQIGFLVAHASV